MSKKRTFTTPAIPGLPRFKYTGYDCPACNGVGAILPQLTRCEACDGSGFTADDPEETA
jgi:DnaJ-class molecular chaperone